MKKMKMLFLMVLLCVSFVGCDTTNPLNNQNDSNQDQFSSEINDEKDINESIVPFESFECITYVDGDTYDYENVVKLNISTLDNIYSDLNLDLENDFYLIDNYTKWLKVHCLLTGEKIEYYTNEEVNKLFVENVMMLIRRTASSSNEIKVVYQDNTTNNKLKVSYPCQNKNDDDILLNCFDLVTIPRSNFERLYPNFFNDSIPFELIEDYELLEFYNESIFINDINGFYPVYIYQDIGTSTRFAKVHERYNEDYFKEYSLGIIKFATCSSELGIELKKVKYENDKIVTIYNINSSYTNTEDEIYSYFVFQVKKEDIVTQTKNSYDIDIKVNNILNPEIGSSHYDKYVKKCKLTVIDNYNLLLNKLEEQYEPGEEIIVRLMFLSGPRVGLKINDNIIESSYEISIQGGELFKFTMPNEDSTLYITWNGFITKPCNDDEHVWDKGELVTVPGSMDQEMLYTCTICRKTKTEFIQSGPRVHLTVTGDATLIQDGLEGDYPSYHHITLTYDALSDKDILVTLDGVNITKSINGNKWSYDFELSNKDATLNIQSIEAIYQKVIDLFGGLSENEII